MNEMDLYYRALRQYRDTVVQDKNHARLIQSVQKASAKNDRLETIRSKCIIDENWIIAIEQALPFIEKAIREDRQFIRQEGEIVRIEKAKKVSKASVSHLARHSDLITHLPDNEDDPLLPDKIYITENESNYAVYENRFLYMLLCYTRDFVELRYTKISELGNTYRGSLRINKHVEIGKRTITFDATLNEVVKNDPLSEADRWINELIERLESIRVQVTALLLTPLMNEVSKTPMIHPPITRTNVLRMDNNFKRAVELYDYLSAYEGDGYTVEEIKKRISPFPEKVGAELFEVIPVLSHLTYKFGNGLEKSLEEAFLREEEEIALREGRKKLKELEDMRQRLQEKGQTAEEYLIQIQNYVHAMENQITRFQKEQEDAKDTIRRMDEEIAWHKEREDTLKSDLETLRTENETILAQAEEERAAHDELVNQLHQEHETEMQETRQHYQGQLDELSATRLEEKQEFEAQIEKLTTSLRRGEADRLILRARLHAYQGKNNDEPDEDLTERYNFAYLEQERKWFETLYRKYWKKTKKRIRRELLWSKNEMEELAQELAPKESNANLLEEQPHNEEE